MSQKWLLDAPGGESDASVILRAMNGQTGANASNGLGLNDKPGALRTTWAAIQPWLNSNCRASF